MSGMSAAFSAVFGTPLAASVFPMEMVNVGIMQYSALVPCVFAAIVANRFAVNMGIHPEAFTIHGIPALTVANLLKILLLAISVSYLFFGYRSLYRDQVIMQSKYHVKYIHDFNEDELLEDQDDV